VHRARKGSNPNTILFYSLYVMLIPGVNKSDIYNMMQKYASLLTEFNGTYYHNLSSTKFQSDYKYVTETCEKYGTKV